MIRLPTERPVAMPATLLLALLLSGGARAADAPQDAALRPGDPASLLVDGRAGLVWSRCAEGMQWNGRRCTGEALQLTQAQAVALARKRGEGWRLPRVQELRLLARQLVTPRERALVPGLPLDWYWTATAHVEPGRVNPYRYDNVMRGRGDGGGEQMAMMGWAVRLDGAEAKGEVPKATRLALLLVRDAAR